MIVSDTDVETFINYEIRAERYRTFRPGSAEVYQRRRDMTKVTIRDVRGREEDFKLDHHGFEFHQHTSREKEFVDDEQIKAIVYPEIVELLKAKTGATRVLPFSHVVRRNTYEKAEEIAKDADPLDRIGFVATARFAHCDQSYNGAVQILEDNGTEADNLGKTRWGIINVWRPIRPIRREPFAACDASTTLEEDLAESQAVLPKQKEGTFENVSKGGGFFLWNGYSNPKHRWYYQSNMTPDEVMFVKCFDSKKDGRSRRTLHSAFVNPKTKDDPRPRESIETRCLVFWEDQSVE